MSQHYSSLSATLIDFIQQQKMFFVGTAVAEGRVNISPKGMDSLRVINNQRVVWLNVTGSGNETSAHVQINPRMTLMFCAFEGAPLILRLYGTAKVIHQHDAEWDALYSLFDPLPGARQLFDVTLDLVQTSCGMAVPTFDFVSDRTMLSAWANKLGDQGLQAYWQAKNQFSIDNIPTHIVDKNKR